VNTPVSPTRSRLFPSPNQSIDSWQAIGIADASPEETQYQLEEASIPAKPLAQHQDVHSSKLLRSEWGIFASTFVTIFLAELGDKTQVTTLLISAGSRSPWIVFAGAAAALVLTSLIGVLLGRWLATRISPRCLETAVSGLFLLIAVMLLWDVVHL
jgi:putative Ca2+/H+ antiporter (TMEM165/GDT1 family)